MTRDELTEVLIKISAIEQRSWTSEESGAWFEVLGGRNLDDTLNATISFYSKPFVHRAYPGDINTIVEDIESERLHSLGDIGLNEADWATADDIGQVHRILYQHARKGRLTRARYDEYRTSSLTLEEFLAQEEVLTGG